MREIITVQVGGGGNAIGQEFFNVICAEHGIDPNTGEYIGQNPLQLERRNLFFKEGHKNFFARALAIDSDPESINLVRSGPLRAIYSPANLIYGESSTGNNFAKGYYDIGKTIIDPIMDAIRLEVESADSMQGVQVIHTLGGGTGSGLSALIWERLIDEYKEKSITQTISIMPSPKLSTVIVEPYNCVHCFPYLLNYTHLTFCIDNEALYNICVNRLNLGGAIYRDTNHLVAHAMSGVTACLRFPGQLNTGLRKLYVNMVPYPNLHFLVPGFAPLTACNRAEYDKLSLSEMVVQIFSPTNMYAGVDFRKSKILTVAAIFRGLISPIQVDVALQNVRTKYSSSFINWIPNNIETAYCDIPPLGLNIAATFIGNTDGITQILTRISNQFTAMYNRKAYIHWFTEYGMEEAQFEESRQKLLDLVEEYHQHTKDSEIPAESVICSQPGKSTKSNVEPPAQTENVIEKEQEEPETAEALEIPGLQMESEPKIKKTKDKGKKKKKKKG